jgi:predicted transcriptional regulator
MSELPDPEDVAGAPTGDARSTTLQVLLNVEELDELERLAAHRGLSKSAVAREAILRLVRAEEAPLSAEDRRLAQDWQIYP